MARSICPEGLELIKSFEGLRLEAYPDPGTGAYPWTIGWGHTSGVEPGDVIDVKQAEEFLQQDLVRFEEGIEDLIPGLKIHEFSALVSWGFNVGLGAVGDSTLRRRINSGEDPQVVIPEELPRWCKGAHGVMPGLVRRRDAEVELAQVDAVSPEKAPEPPAVTTDTTDTPHVSPGGSEVSLTDFFAYYTGAPWQVSATRILEEDLKEYAPHLLLDSAEWIKEYRNGPPKEPEQPEQPYLNVPYLYQYDSDTEQGARMCFSSSNAMLVEFLKPGTLRGTDQPDDAYLDQVLEYGDTTSAEAQVQALAHYGVEAQFRMDGTSQQVKDLIRSGVPVPVGILIRGHVSAPGGGGHWIVLVGFDDLAQQWIVHDPAGELDCLNGGYVASGPTDGRFVRYSYKNLNPRWMVAGEGDGWLMEAVQW